MIRGVFFDMDGVLIDAKEWHYEALNRALELFGMPIDRQAHLATFDGLPTRRKLEILSRSNGLPHGLSELIHALKQDYTMELIYTCCRPVFAHQYALSRLKHEGYEIAVCSNSIRDTVESMMRRAGLIDYIDLIVSNEDVTRSKPDPEMYLTTMERFGLRPEECLILEDNEYGLKAARDSGAHVLQVGSPADVVHGRIVSEIKLISEVPA
jgi:beta-phosphoglucomutase